MNPWILLDQEKVPNDGAMMTLYQRAFEFSISIKNEELMNNRMHGSEDALAELTCKKIATHESPTLLIGGLGMGFTLRSALDHSPSDASILVAELVPAVIKWNKSHLAHLADHPLDDPRVTVHQTDVATLIKGKTNAYDAILLDVDNGPDGLTHENNNKLYTHHGLSLAKAALKKGGILAIWSAEPDKSFNKRLQGSGFRFEEVQVRARGKKGRWHTIWLAEK